MKVVYWFFAVITLALCSYAQGNKVIDWPPIASDQAAVIGDSGKSIATDLQALELVEIRVQEKTIKLGQSFSAGGAWLKSFAVKVKNISNKNISSIRLSFGLPEAKSSNGSGSGFSLEYGKELSTGIDYGVQPPIEPGQEVVLMRNDSHYTRDANGIAKRIGITEFNTVFIGDSVVKFADGTVWTTYKLPITSAVPNKIN